MSEFMIADAVACARSRAFPSIKLNLREKKILQMEKVLQLAELANLALLGCFKKEPVF